MTVKLTKAPKIVVRGANAQTYLKAMLGKHLENMDRIKNNVDFYLTGTKSRQKFAEEGKALTSGLTLHGLTLKGSNWSWVDKSEGILFTELFQRGIKFNPEVARDYLKGNGEKFEPIVRKLLGDLYPECKKQGVPTRALLMFQLGLGPSKFEKVQLANFTIPKAVKGKTQTEPKAKAPKAPKAPKAKAKAK